MSQISKGRRVGQAALNALRTLLEEHDHIVQEISGQNDFGEDFIVTFVDSGRVTSDVIKVQVKGGNRWRRANGYSVPVGRHRETWANGNIPVYCVVYDPALKQLCWANATQQLRRSGYMHSPEAIGISPSAVLNEATMATFVAQARRYVGRYRGRQAVLTHLEEMSGADFDPSDHVLHFVNGSDEDLIFWRRPGEAAATLLLSAHEWDPFLVTLDSLMPSELPAPQDEADAAPPPVRSRSDADLATAEDLCLTRTEVMWVAACFISTRELDEDAFGSEGCEGCPDCTGEELEEHGSIDAEVLEDYVIARIIERVEAEPDLLDRSISALRGDARLEAAFVAELGPLEADPRIVRQVIGLGRTTVDDLDPDAFRLAILYLIDHIRVGGPSLPFDQQVRIVWRIPERKDAAHGKPM
jgi:hypothetical protein